MEVHLSPEERKKGNKRNGKGFEKAIKSVFPKAEQQLCVIHQIRNSIKYVASKGQKVFMADLKKVYKALTKAMAEQALDELEKKWGENTLLS